MVSSREVGRPCLFKVIVITHSQLPGFNSFKSKELSLSAAGLCPSLPTNITAPLAKCSCAPELRNQGEEVKDKTVHCRINLQNSRGWSRIPPESLASSTILQISTANFHCFLICCRNPQERADHFTDQEAEAQSSCMLCPRSPGEVQESGPEHGSQVQRLRN